MNIYEIVAYSWAGVNLGIVMGFLMGISFFYWVNQSFYVNDVTQVDHLKDALLSLALIMVKNDDIDKDFDMNYKSYDGTKLPHISGCSTENACFTYIMKNPYDHILYSRKLDDEQGAIHKYLEKNLNTQAQIIEFFDAFYKKITEMKTSKNFAGDDKINMDSEEEEDDDDDSISIVSEYNIDNYLDTNLTEG